MCWNAEISLNTFLFSAFVLLLILYNNAYTKYKINSFENKWFVLFVVLVISVQLLEHFIWKNMKNREYNIILSGILYFIVFLEPVATTMMISDETLRNTILFLYLITGILYTAHMFHEMGYPATAVSSTGHLKWNYGAYWPHQIGFLVFLVFPFVYEKMWRRTVIGIISFLFAFYNYTRDGTTTTMWCWIINSMMIIASGYLLIYLPFLEKCKLC
jgi:hypothetical protein